MVEPIDIYKIWKENQLNDISEISLDYKTKIVKKKSKPRILKLFVFGTLVLVTAIYFYEKFNSQKLFNPNKEDENKLQ